MGTDHTHISGAIFLETIKYLKIYIDIMPRPKDYVPFKHKERFISDPPPMSETETIPIITQTQKDIASEAIEKAWKEQLEKQRKGKKKHV